MINRAAKWSLGFAAILAAGLIAGCRMLTIG